MARMALHFRANLRGRMDCSFKGIRYISAIARITGFEHFNWDVANSSAEASRSMLRSWDVEGWTVRQIRLRLQDPSQNPVASFPVCLSRPILRRVRQGIEQHHQIPGVPRRAAQFDRGC